MVFFGRLMSVPILELGDDSGRFKLVSLITVDAGCCELKY